MPTGYFPSRNRSGELIGQGLSAFGQNFLAARQNRDVQRRQDESDQLARTTFEYGHPGFHFLKPGEQAPEQGPGEIVPSALPSARVTPSAFQAAFTPFVNPPAEQQGSAIQRMAPERYRMFDGAYENVDERRQAEVQAAALKTGTVFREAFEKARGTVAADPTQPAYRQAQTEKLRSDMAKPAKIEQPIMGSPEWLAAQEALAKMRARYRPAPASATKPDPTQVLVSPDGVVIVDKKTGTSRRVAAPDAAPTAPGGAGASPPQLQAAQRNPLKAKAIANRTQLRAIDRALANLDTHPDAVGLRRAVPFLGDKLNQIYDPEGTNTRADIADVGSLVLHDRSGAAITVSEWPRLAPFIPRVSDTKEAVRAKLLRMKELVEQETEALEAGGGSGNAPPGSPSKSGVASKYGITPSR